MKHYLKALHPEAAVLHLEQQLLSQNALKLTQGVLMGPQPQLKGLPHHITTTNQVNQHLQKLVVQSLSLQELFSST